MVQSPNPFGSESQSVPNSNANTAEIEQLNEKIKELQERNYDLLQTNSSMSKQILTLQQKHEQLESKIDTLKRYKWTLHHAAGIQCLQCSQMYTREDFAAHLAHCKEKVARVSTLQAREAITPIKIKLVEATTRQVFSSGEICPEVEASKFVYKIEITYRGKTVNMTKDLNELISFLQ